MRDDLTRSLAAAHLKAAASV